MSGEASCIARIHYYEDGVIRFIKGTLIEENDDFITVELKKYIVTISKKEIAKLEVSKVEGF